MRVEAYLRELAYLREVGGALGARHPALAGVLAAGGSDPDVERLLSGFAFVAARLRERIDHAAPALVEGLAELLFPELLRPTPASTIVQFECAPRSLRGRRRIARGTPLFSRPVEGTRCTFVTTRELELLPLRLTESVLDDGSESHPELTLRFALEPGTEARVFAAASLRLHLHGEPALTSQLYLWLARHLAEVRVQAGGASVVLPPSALACTSIMRDEPLLPWPGLAPHGARLLREYYTLPAKFLFAELTGLEHAAALAADRFEVVLRFERPPRLPGRLPPDLMRLHCVPAVNLFDAGAEPIGIDARERPVPLRVAGLDPAHAEVFEVRAVVGLAQGRPRETYPAFHAQGPAGEARTGTYRLERRRSVRDDGVDTFLQLVRDGPARLPDRAGVDEVVSVELTCTNRSLPVALHRGDLSTVTAAVGPGVTFANIAPVSPPSRAPVGEPLLWRFVAQLGCSRRGLTDGEALRSLLSLYARDERDDPTAARAQRARIDAVLELRTTTTARAMGGVAVRGTHHQLELAARSFDSEGEAYLFAAVLHQLLALEAPLNSFADLTARLDRGDACWHFEAACG